MCILRVAVVTIDCSVTKLFYSIQFNSPLLSPLPPAPRNVPVLLPGEEGHRQHPETPGQGGGSLYDDDQRPDAEQGARGDDHVSPQLSRKHHASDSHSADASVKMASLCDGIHSN